MAVGYIDKDFIEEGPFGCVFYNIQMDDPAALSDVRLWMTEPGSETTYWLADGQQDTDQNGDVVYVFNGDTLEARKMEPDGSLETKMEDVDGDGEDEEIVVTSTLQPQKRYIAEVTFTLGVLDVRAIGARAEIELRKSYALGR